MKVVVGNPTAVVFAVVMIGVGWPIAAVAFGVGAWAFAFVLAALPVPTLVRWSHQVVMVARGRIVTCWPPARFPGDPSLEFEVRDVGPDWIVLMIGAGLDREIMRVPAPWWTPNDRMQRR